MLSGFRSRGCGCRISPFIRNDHPRCMKKILGLLVMCALPLSGNAQLDLNALKRQSDAKAQERKNESRDFQTERNARWKSFMVERGEEWAKTIANRDLEWSDLLNDSEWTLFDGFLTNKQPEKPKPTVVPKIETEPVSKPQLQPIVLPAETVAKPVPAPVTVPEAEAKPEPLPCKPEEPVKEVDKSSARFIFYGRTVSIAYDRNLKSFSRKKYGKSEISEFWKAASGTNYTPTVTALMEEKEAIGLNGWGYYLLVNKFSQQVYSDSNCSMLLTWFLLVRSGLDARVGYNDGGPVLLLPTTTTLFEMSYVMMDGVKYYVINNATGSGVRTCPGSYADGHQFDFSQKKSLQLGGNSAVRTLSFEFKGQLYNMNFRYDADLAEYYKALPQAQFEIFFEASPSTQLKNSVRDNLKPIVEKMDKPTALNFLLQFVQFSFPYKTDPQQFGYEKYFYADELFFYPYCDCEDRSVLFSYLAHELLGYDVVGTEFSEHMATAVALDYSVNGVKYTIGNKTYTVADPTYIGASVGQCMSKYETAKPIIHKIDFAQ